MTTDALMDAVLRALAKQNITDGRNPILKAVNALYKRAKELEADRE